ncbi:hypothetical protein BpHYR1_021318, partial [Brachionus plicatilis]
KWTLLLEVRIDQVRDDYKQKNTIKEFILNNGGRERGGLARFRTVENRKKLSIFVSMKRIYENKWLFDMLRDTPIEGRILTLWAEEEVEVLGPREHVTPPKEPPVKTSSQATLKTPTISAQNDNVFHHQNPHLEPPTINIYPKVVVKVDTESLISRLGLGRARLYRPVSALTLPTPRAGPSPPSQESALQTDSEEDDRTFADVK